MAVATVAALALRIPGGIELADHPSAGALLDDVTAFLAAETGLDLDEAVPGLVKTVGLAVAKRAWLNREELDTETIGGYARTRAWKPGIWLTTQESRMLAKATGSTSGGFWVQPIERTDTVLGSGDDTVWLNQSGGGDPVPFL